MATKMSVKDATERLERHIESMWNSEEFKKWLKTLSAFPSYSLNNTLMITMQNPSATKVCGFKKWNELGRKIKAGESGLKIFAPGKKTVREIDVLDKYGKPVLDDDGNPKKKKIEWMNFFLVSVFDISQTEGDELPADPCITLEDELDGAFDLYYALEDACPVPVKFFTPKNTDERKGYYSQREQAIYLADNMSEAQTVSTLINCLAQEDFHSKGIALAEDSKNILAESVAYTVCSHFEFDTSDYSLGYIAKWAKDKGPEELKNSLETIRQSAADLIKRSEKALASFMA